MLTLKSHFSGALFSPESWKEKSKLLFLNEKCYILASDFLIKDVFTGIYHTFICQEYGLMTKGQ
jgi:hypothetical protein